MAKEAHIRDNTEISHAMIPPRWAALVDLSTCNTVHSLVRILMGASLVRLPAPDVSPVYSQ
jgi:hypothetical protein